MDYTLNHRAIDLLIVFLSKKISIDWPICLVLFNDIKGVLTDDRMVQIGFHRKKGIMHILVWHSYLDLSYLNRCQALIVQNKLSTGLSELIKVNMFGKID